MAGCAAITVTEKNFTRGRDDVATVEGKKRSERDLNGLGYGLQQQEYHEHLYGPPAQPAPVYEVPAADVGHPVSAHAPEPSPPFAVGHPIG